MNIKLYNILILLFSIFIFSSCGGGSDTKWGIDHSSSKQIPVCNGDKATTTNAIIVLPKQEIEQLRSSTVIRIWHYQNGDKLVCTVQGRAILEDAK